MWWCLISFWSVDPSKENRYLPCCQYSKSWIFGLSSIERKPLENNSKRRENLVWGMPWFFMKRRNWKRKLKLRIWNPLVKQCWPITSYPAIGKTRWRGRYRLFILISKIKQKMKPEVPDYLKSKSQIQPANSRRISRRRILIRLLAAISPPIFGALYAKFESNWLDLSQNKISFPGILKQQEILILHLSDLHLSKTFSWKKLTRLSKMDSPRRLMRAL